MKPVALLTTDDNLDYLFCLPITVKTWELQAFEVMPCIVSNRADVKPFMDKYIKGARMFKPDASIKSELNPSIYTQCLRLYLGRNRPRDQYCIMGDVDMLIASSFLYRDFDKVNVFGHDLTDFNEIPMCYVGMSGKKWQEIMGDGTMKQDIEKYTKYKSKVWHEAWGADQQILTAKLQAYGYENINFINRRDPLHKDNIPEGRLDRSSNFAIPLGDIHDVHLMRKPFVEHSVFMIEEILSTIYPRQNWEWVEDYAHDFIKTFKIWEHALQD